MYLFLLLSAYLVFAFLNFSMLRSNMLGGKLFGCSRNMHSQPERIPLSALWIALHCPNVGQVDRCSLSRPSRPGAPHRMARHVLYGGRGARPGEDAQQVQQKRYEHLMPNMKCEQFIKEVLDISRTAAGKKYAQAIIKFAP